MGRRKRLLVPEAREAMERLKLQVIQDQVASSGTATPNPGQRTASTSGPPTVDGVASKLGIPYHSHGNADMTTRQAGRIGGEIGGPMVKRLISLAEQSLQNEAAARSGARKPS